MRIVSLIAVVAVVGIGAYLMLQAGQDSDENTVDSAVAVPQEAENARVSSRADRRGEFNDDFAELNKQREGVTTLSSGVQYEVLEAGFGDTPMPADTVLVRYEAVLSDGRVFDSTEEDQQPLELPLESIAIPGLKEAILLMEEGAHWRVVIPPGAGIGRFGNNRLRRSDLIYEIRLVSIVG